MGFDNLFKRKPREAPARRSQGSYGGPLPAVTPLEFLELQTKATDPNKAKYWALGLCAGACLFATLTIRSNYAYFNHYYDGYDFAVRVIVGATLEAMIIAWTLTKGWGNHKQMIAAIFFELAMITTALYHTSLVAQSEQTRKIAEKTKTEAVADYSTGKSARDEVIAQNDKLRKGYQEDLARFKQSMAAFRRSAQAYNSMSMVARDNGRQLGAPPSPPTPPEQPTYLKVPEIKESVVANTQINVAEATEQAVDHKLLNRLLYLMAFESIAGMTAMAWLADSSRLRAWLMKLRGQELDAAMKQTPIGMASSTTYGTNSYANPIGFTTTTAPALPPAASDERPTSGTRGK